jgi:hypothetical protein
MIARELVMIEVAPLRCVLSTDVHNQGGEVVEVTWFRLPSFDRCTMLRDQQTAGQKVVFVCPARMSENEINGHEERTVAGSERGAMLVIVRLTPPASGRNHDKPRNQAGPLLPQHRILAAGNRLRRFQGNLAVITPQPTSDRNPFPNLSPQPAPRSGAETPSLPSPESRSPGE